MPRHQALSELHQKCNWICLKLCSISERLYFEFEIEFRFQHSDLKPCCLHHFSSAPAPVCIHCLFCGGTVFFACAQFVVSSVYQMHTNGKRLGLWLCCCCCCYCPHQMFLMLPSWVLAVGYWVLGPEVDSEPCAFKYDKILLCCLWPLCTCHACFLLVGTYSVGTRGFVK